MARFVCFMRRFRRIDGYPSAAGNDFIFSGRVPTLESRRIVPAPAFTLRAEAPCIRKAGKTMLKAEKAGERGMVDQREGRWDALLWKGRAAQENAGFALKDMR